MAKVLVPKKTPKLFGETRFARNGLKPFHTAPLRIGQTVNAVTARARKVVLVHSTTFGASAVGSDTEFWHFAWESGVGETGSLRLRFVAACEEGAKFDVKVTPDGGSEVSDSVNVPASDLDNLRIARGSIDIDPDTLYTGFVEVPNGFKPPISITIYEEHDAGLTPSAATTVDTRAFANKRPIYDTEHQRMVDHSHDLYAKNGRTLLAYTFTHTRTSSTAVNMLDDTSTTVTASTPGFNFHTDNLAPLHDSGAVPVVVRVYGQRAGGFSGADMFQVRDSSGTVASIDVGTSLGWYVDTTVDLVPGSKYDLYFKGDAINAVTISSVMIYLWDE